MNPEKRKRTTRKRYGVDNISQLSSIRKQKSEKMRGVNQKSKYIRRGNPLYVTWSGMHRRCYNPQHKDYKRYGARGIIVVSAWHDFDRFVEDMQESFRPGLSIDRVNNDGPYSKENCRWVSHKEQCNNRNNNYFITCQVTGETLTIDGWANKLGISAGAIRQRITVLKLKDTRLILYPGKLPRNTKYFSDYDAMEMTRVVD